MAKILIAAPGPYGDAFPMFAIAHKLRERGHEITVASTAINLPVVQHLDLPMIEMPEARLTPLLGKTPAPPGLLTEIRLLTSAHRVQQEIDFLQPLATKYDVIVGNQLATGASMVARMHEIPWVFCAASPLALPSRETPPLLPYLQSWQRRIAHPAFDRVCLDAVHGLSKQLMWKVRKLQKRLGIPGDLHPLFEGRHSSDLNLLMVSPALVAQANDWPNNTHVSGFTWFIPGHMRNRRKLAVLKEFIEAGDAPIVFTLGGSRRTSPGDFFTRSIAAAQLLGKRAIIVALQGMHDSLPHPPSTLLTPYLPFQDIFPHASACVHSGGIGTIGLGMRYQVPALLCPSGVDQHDNAWRTQRQGFAHVIEDDRCSPQMLASALEKLLNDGHCRERLSACAAELSCEDGATNAALLIEKTFAL